MTAAPPLVPPCTPGSFYHRDVLVVRHQQQIMRLVSSVKGRDHIPIIDGKDLARSIVVDVSIVAPGSTTAHPPGAGDCCSC
jgi:hypothetical protein